MGAEPLTVLLVADDACTRDCLRRRLAGAGVTVCAEARPVAGTTRLVRSHRPDVCLVHVPIGRRSVAFLRHVSRSAPQTALLVLADDANGPDAASALHAGAHGYLPADCDDRALARSLAAVMRGEAAVPRRFTRHLLRVLHQDGAATLPGRRTASLTVREQEVLAFLYEGMTTGEIAAALVVEPVTVRSHIASVVRKLGVRDRDEAVAVLGAS